MSAEVPSPLDKPHFLAGKQMAMLLRGLILVQLVAFVALGAWFASHFARIFTVAGCYVLAIVVLISIHCAITGIQFLMARGTREMLPREDQLTFSEAVTAYDREVDASMRGIWWANPFQCDAKLPTPIEPHRALPILCVHGYFCTRAVWLPFVRAAVARGYRCQAVTLEPPFCSISAYAGQIQAALDALALRTGATEVVIVAHSMGALAVRAYLRETHDPRVLRLVTLGAPHHGTTLAKFSRAKNTREMRRDSLWLRELNAAETPESLARITSIYSTHDNIVTPYLTAHLPGADNRLIRGVGHVSLLYSSAVWEQIFAAIEEDPNEAPQTP